jgi:site-specific DNA recombinase
MTASPHKPRITGNLALKGPEAAVVAGIYARISDDRPNELGARALGVGRQLTDCRALARKTGWAVHDEYTDNSISAYSGKARPQYERLLADIAEGRINTVIAWHPDRLHRMPRELEDFIVVIERYGVRVVTCTAGDIDFSTAEGRLMARITGAVARKESEDKSRRISRKHIELAAAGKVSGGGRRPFGYEADKVTLRDDEAAMIRDAMAQILAGASLRTVIMDWHKSGSETVTGKPWRPKGLKLVLTSARIAGWREHQGEWVAEAVWPAIVSREEVERARVILHDPERMTGARKRQYLLTGGLVVCGICGKHIVSRAGYVCSVEPKDGGCGRISVKKHLLEGTVVDMIAEAIDDASFTRRLAAAKRPDAIDERALVKSITADEDQLVDLADMWADGKMTKAAYLRAQDRISSRLAATRDKLSAVAAPSPDAVVALYGGVKRLRAVWRDLPVADQRTVVAGLMHKVTVMPAQRRGVFDTERVVPDWRI